MSFHWSRTILMRTNIHPLGYHKFHVHGQTQSQIHFSGSMSAKAQAWRTQMSSLPSAEFAPTRGNSRSSSANISNETSWICLTSGCKQEKTSTSYLADVDRSIQSWSKKDLREGKSIQFGNQYYFANKVFLHFPSSFDRTKYWGKGSHSLWLSKLFYQ